MIQPDREIIYEQEVQQLTAENADLKKRVKELDEECEAQQYQFDILKKDPACVWANMLRGNIATPSALVEAHDYQQIKAENADLRAKLEKAQRSECATRRELVSHREKAHGNYWAWDEIEENNLKSLVCPILIHPEALLEIVNTKEQAEAKCAEMREAVQLVLDAYTFMSASSREPLSKFMQREENQVNVFRLVVALNNLKKHALSTSFGTGLASPEKVQRLREVILSLIEVGVEGTDPEIVKQALETEAP